MSIFQGLAQRIGKKVAARIILVGLAMIFAGILLLAENGGKKGVLTDTPAYLNTMRPNDIQKGQFISGDIKFVVDEFAYYSYDTRFSTKENVTKRYYLCAMETSTADGQLYLFGVEVTDEMTMKKADNMMRQFYALDDLNGFRGDPDSLEDIMIYVLDKQKGSADYDQSISYLGVAEEMSSELRGYLNDSVSSLTDEGYDINKNVCPYVLTFYSEGASRNNNTTGILLIVVGVFTALITGILTFGVPLIGWGISNSEKKASKPAEPAEDISLYMNQMQNLQQPTDADDFFGDSRKKTETPAPTVNENKAAEEKAPPTMDEL